LIFEIEAKTLNTRSGVTYDGAELIKIVHDLVENKDFNPKEFVIAGSARLWLEGYIPRLSDVDLVAIGYTWDLAWDLAVEAKKGIASFGEAPLNGGKSVKLFDSRIEIFNSWIPPHNDPYRLVAEAECIGGLRYPSVQTVVEYKRVLGREKDQADLARLPQAEATAQGLRPSAVEHLHLC
jgi:hypothetical protein